MNPHRASDCIYHLQVFLKSFLGFRNFRASCTQWFWLWVLERIVNCFSCMATNIPESTGISIGISILLWSPTNRKIYLYCGCIIKESWVSKWAQTYFLNRVCRTSCMVINLSAKYFGLSKDFVTHFEGGLFALVHYDCWHLSEGISFLGTTRYISICYLALKLLYIMQLKSRAPFQNFTLLY